MKYIIFTYDGFGFPIAKQLQDEGHEVIVGQVEDFKSTLTKIERRRNGEELSIDKKRRLSLYKNIIDRIPADLLIKK